MLKYEDFSHINNGNPLKMKALTFSKFSTPEVLAYIEVADPVLKQDEILVVPRMLMDTSTTLTGGDLWSYLVSKEPVTFSLRAGRLAHEYLESWKSAGKVLLIP